MSKAGVDALTAVEYSGQYVMNTTVTGPDCYEFS